MEILIVLLIVGSIFGLAVNQFRKMTSRNMKASARKLASTIRYLYNKAASEGVTLRLVFNIGESSYKVEATSEQFTLSKEEKEVFSKSKPSKKEEAKEKEGALKPHEAQFSAEESTLLKPVKLPPGVFFKDVHAEHQAGPATDGEATLYFFPQGYAERGVINLRDNDDELHFSLEVNPLTGSVKIREEYKELEVPR